MHKMCCNTIHPLMSSLQAQLNLGYLDDVTLAGPVDMVASDVAEIIRVGADIGLSLDNEILDKVDIL